MDRNTILKTVANSLGFVSEGVKSLENKVLSKMRSGEDILSEKNNFSDFVRYKVVDGEKVECFPGEYICLMLDKETNEITWFIFVSYMKGVMKMCYEIETGEMVLYEGVGIKVCLDDFKELACNSYKFNMKDINYYLNDVTLKESYTMDELKELEPRLKKAILVMNDVKVKKRI